MKIKVKLPKEYKKEAFLISMWLKERMIEDKINPDLFLIEVIKDIYGHKVDLSKFIELVETSPL